MGRIIFISIIRKLRTFNPKAINEMMREVLAPPFIAMPSASILIGDISFNSLDASATAYMDVTIADMKRRNSNDEKKIRGIYPKKGMIIQTIITAKDK